MDNLTVTVAVRYTLDMKPIWERKRPKGLGKSKKLSPAQLVAARAMAKKAGRKYPNLIDNMRAARMKA